MLRIRRWKTGVAPALLVAALVAARTAAAQEPVMVVSAKSVDTLLGDVKYILTAGGSPQLGDLVDGMIDQFTQGKGLQGIDRSKPVGAFATLSPAGTPDLVVFIPVNDPKSFRDLLALYLPNQQDLEEGMFAIQSEGQQFYGRFSNGYCFMTLLPAALAKLPDPTRIASGKHDVAIETDLSKLPDDAKEAFVQQIEMSAAAAQADQPAAANEAEARGRELGQRMALGAVRIIIKESQHLSIGLDVDKKAEAIVLSGTATARPGTALAKTMETYGATTSRFAALAGPKASANVLVAAPLSDSAREVLGEALNNAAAEGHKNIDNSDAYKSDQKKALHPLLDHIISVIRATGESGSIDTALVVEPVSDKKVRVVAAARVEHGEELEKAIEEFVHGAGSQPGSDVIKLDVVKHAGAHIHEVHVQLADEATARLGDGTAHLAIRNDSVFFAIGGDSLAAVQEALDKAGKPGPKRPPISVRLQPSRVIGLLGTANDPNTALAREAFAGKGDRMAFEVEPIEQGARARIELGEGFLRFFALMVGQQLGAGQ
jgi:hypothetical protein